MNQTGYRAETRDIRKHAERIESDAVPEISRGTVSAAAEKISDNIIMAFPPAPPIPPLRMRVPA